VFLYVLITRFIGYLWTFRLTSLLFAAFLVVIPFSPKLIGPLPDNLKNETLSDFCKDKETRDDISESEHLVEGVPWTFWLLLAILYSLHTFLRLECAFCYEILFADSLY